MVAKLIDGREIAKQERRHLSELVSQASKKYNRPPGLGVILVGEDPASEVYVKNKSKACNEVGITSEVFKLPVSISQQQLFDKIDELNNTQSMDGILVQLPLPQQLDTTAIVERIAPHKDVDGFHPYNLGRLAQRQPALQPCTPYGVMTLLSHTGVDYKKSAACVVGASNVVGRPMALELLNAGCTVTVCHRFTQDLKLHVSNADILVVAVGKPKFLPGDWIKPGAIIIDVGINRTSDGKLVGDIDFETAQKTASWITPVPGGVGPMTVCTLLKNTLDAFISHMES